MRRIERHNATRRKPSVLIEGRTNTMTNQQANAKKIATNRNINKAAAIKDFVLLMGYEAVTDLPKTWKEAISRFA